MIFVAGKKGSFDVYEYVGLLASGLVKKLKKRFSKLKDPIHDIC